MKRILKKVLIVILIILMLNNFVIISTVHATEQLGNAISGLFSGVIGTLTFVYRAPAVLIGMLINKFMAALAFAEGSTDPSQDVTFLTVSDILFTKSKLISIDFFDITDGDDSLVNVFRTNVATWFYITRNISAVILLVILLYIGIRMAISTVASDKAMYKKMLVDWTVSLLLIFVLNYLIIFIIAVNQAIINSLEVVQNSTGLSNAINQFGEKGIAFFADISSIVAAIIYLMLIWQTMSLFISYFNRMLKIAFLIIISPLISLTYAIDKMGDGKSQALDSWLKEFVFTVLTQPFHCVIYLSLIDTAMNLLIERGNDFGTNLSQTLGVGIISIVCILFTKDAEKIVRKIFGFQDDNSATSLVAGAALASLAVNKAQNLGTGAVSAYKGGKNFLKKGTKAFKPANLGTGIIAAVKYLKGGNITKDENGQEREKDFSEIRSEEREKIYAKKAQQQEEKLKKIHDKREKRKEKKLKDKYKMTKIEAISSEKIKNEAEKLRREDPRMSKEESEAIARFNIAKDMVNKKSVPRRIVKAPSTIKTWTGNKLSEISDTLPFSETRSLLKDEMKNSVGLVTGAATLMYTGKVSGAVAAGIATNKAINDFSDNKDSGFYRRVDNLIDKHSQKDNSSALLDKVANNAEDYNISDNSDDLPQHLQDLINELNNAYKEIGMEAVDQDDIRNTIVRNTKDPISKMDGVLKTNDIGKKPDTNLTILERAQNACNALKDYSVEYAINQEMSNAQELNISSGELINKVVEKRQKENPNEARNIQIATDFMDDKESLKENVQEIKANNPEQLEQLYEMLQQRINDRINNSKTSKLTDEARERYENRTKEYEMKLLSEMANAVADIKKENEDLIENLRIKMVSKVEELLNSNAYNKTDLQNIKDKLENIKNS